MTNEEAKKAGFRTASGALYVYWCIENGHIYVRSCDTCALTGSDFPTRAKAREELRKRKLDAEHAKWLADMQSQTTPITKEQGELLRDGDIWFWAFTKTEPEGEPEVIECNKLKRALGHSGVITKGEGYFTRAAAQAALDKAKAVESHDQAKCETQPKEVVTDETQPKVGNKYHRTIHGVTGGSVVVDVYNVLDAFGVTCPACQHAIKKLLCAGLRNKGSRLQDLSEAAESASRAVTLEKQREQ